MHNKLPRLIINLKNYDNVSGDLGLKFLSKIAKVVDKFEVPVGIAVGAIDLKMYLTLAGPNLYIFAQHVDPVSFGSGTGKINPEYLQQLGVIGSLLNHSENRLKMQVIDQSVVKLKQQEMLSVVCVENVSEALEVSVCKPNVLAYEPAELIGGDVSVMTKKEIVMDLLSNVEIPVMVGAGIKDENDIKVAMEIGCYGVLVASGIVKAENPEVVVEKFLEIIQTYV